MLIENIKAKRIEDIEENGAESEAESEAEAGSAIRTVDSCNATGISIITPRDGNLASLNCVSLKGFQRGEARRTKTFEIASE